jgi:hypothetical protein
MCAPGEWVKTYLTRRGAFAQKAKLWNSSAWIAKIILALGVGAPIRNSAVFQRWHVQDFMACFKRREEVNR